MNEIDAVYIENLKEHFYECDTNSNEYINIFSEIVDLAINGHSELASLVAESYAFDSRLYNPELAYFFYNISMKEEGFFIDFENKNTTESSYLGNPGDFRNESQVAELVQTLGISKCQELDQKANNWRTTYKGN